MPPERTPPAAATDGDRLAETRERFLTAQEVEPHRVRDSILASWWRSRRANVAADRIDLSYVRDPDLDTTLTRGALPVLRNLRDHLDGQPISIILTDPTGVVLVRMTGDRDLERHLDGVQLAPGFSYAEERVGTNGIGTALEAARPAHVFGHEHYAENLENLACAGVPIHHPITGKTVGAIDLTCWRRDAGPLLITLAKTTADQIQHALLAEEGGREFALLREYLRACRRTSGIVFAFNSDVAMMNEYARQALDPAAQSVLLGQAAEVLTSGHATTTLVELPAGGTARMYCRPVYGDGPLSGGVVHVKLLEPGGRRPAAAGTPVRGFLPGLVGTGALWLRAGLQVDAGYEAGEWLVLAGEPGVGKVALVRAVLQRRNPGGRMRVLDAAEAGRDWLAQARREVLETTGAVVIRHAHRLTARQAATLGRALRDARGPGERVAGERGPGGTGRPWVVVTVSGADHLGGLVDLFPSTVEVPPLRHHIEDLHDLVPFFLARLVPDGRLVCSPEAMQQLMRSPWPGNTEQLWQVLRKVVAHRRTGAIHAEDLPPECRTLSRRVLSPLESLERDAIVQGLVDADGNKVRAARSLGMSRATIYRKIHEYGIVAPTA